MRVTPISSYNIELCTIFDVCNVFSCKSQFIQLQRNAVKAEFDLKEQMKMFISVKKRKWKCWYLVQMLNFDLVCFKPLSWTEALKMPPVKSVIPSNPKSKVWRHFGDSLDGEFAQCLICKDNKTIAIHIKVCGVWLQDLVWIWMFSLVFDSVPNKSLAVKYHHQ